LSRRDGAFPGLIRRFGTTNWGSPLTNGEL
jgi:hypothetical protein